MLCQKHCTGHVSLLKRCGQFFRTPFTLGRPSCWVGCPTRQAALAAVGLAAVPGVPSLRLCQLTCGTRGCGAECSLPFTLFVTSTRLCHLLLPWVTFGSCFLWWCIRKGCVLLFSLVLSSFPQNWGQACYGEVSTPIVVLFLMKQCLNLKLRAYSIELAMSMSDTTSLTVSLWRLACLAYSCTTCTWLRISRK